MRTEGIKRHYCDMLLALLLLAPSAHAKPVVQFAGFAYAGAYRNIQTAYPYTAAINVPAPSGIDLLGKALMVRIRGQHFPGFRIDMSGLGRIHGNNPLALAFDLTHETVSVEHIGGYYKILVILGAQALFFNIAKMQIVADYPVGFQYVDLSNTKPAPSSLRDLVRSLYVGHRSANIFNAFLKTLQRVQLKPNYGHTIAVTQVVLSPKARQQLADLSQNDPSAIKMLIAQQFSADLTRNNSVPVLPYMKDYAIGNKISARFANGTVFNLQIPKPDYSVILTLLKFKKLPYSQDASGSSWIYGVFLHIKVLEPLSARTYLDATVKDGAVKLVPASETIVPDWPAYEETLFDLLNKLTLAIQNPTRRWAKTHTGDSRNVFGLLAAKKVIASCQ